MSQDFLHRKASFNYHIEGRYIAGLVLCGSEVKSLRSGKLSFNDSYCYFHDGELFVRNLHIPEYGLGHWSHHTPLQDRKLLLNRRELRKLEGKMKEKGISIIPLRVFFSDNGWAKMEIGWGKGKKHYDKRDTIKKRDVEREMKRTL